MPTTPPAPLSTFSRHEESGTDLAEAVRVRSSRHGGRDFRARLADARRDRVVLECVAALPEAYQAAVRLHYWMDASVAEIASLLAVPENTVKSYLHRARRLLEAMLKTRGLA